MNLPLNELITKYEGLPSSIKTEVREEFQKEVRQRSDSRFNRLISGGIKTPSEWDLKSFNKVYYKVVVAPFETNRSTQHLTP